MARLVLPSLPEQYAGRPLRYLSNRTSSPIISARITGTLYAETKKAECRTFLSEITALERQTYL